MTFCRTKAVLNLIQGGLENSEDWKLENGKTKLELAGFRAALSGMAKALPMADRFPDYCPIAIDCSNGIVTIHFDRDEQAHEFFEFVAPETETSRTPTTTDHIVGRAEGAGVVAEALEPADDLLMLRFDRTAADLRARAKSFRRMHGNMLMYGEGQAQADEAAANQLDAATRIISTLARTAFSALSKGEGVAVGGVTVRPLEWVYRDWARAQWCASTPLGLDYFARDRDGIIGWNALLEARNDTATLDEAKAAAQADYEKRVLSCLSASPVPPVSEVDGEEPVADDGLCAETKAYLRALDEHARSPMPDWVCGAPALAFPLPVDGEEPVAERLRWERDEWKATAQGHLVASAEDAREMKILTDRAAVAETKLLELKSAANEMLRKLAIYSDMTASSYAMAAVDDFRAALASPQPVNDLRVEIERLTKEAAWLRQCCRLEAARVTTAEARVAQLEVALRRSLRAMVALPGITSMEIADCITGARAALATKETAKAKS